VLIKRLSKQQKHQKVAPKLDEGAQSQEEPEHIVGRDNQDQID